jgi:hypothetical protein
LCHDLGAHEWVDFRESKDVVADVIAASDGLGVEGAVVAAGDVSYNLAKGSFNFLRYYCHVFRQGHSTKH